MARQTQIEASPHRVSIEIAKAAGISLDRIAAKYGVQRDAIARHWKGLDAAYRAALIADVPREELVERAVAESGNLLDHFKMHRSIVEEALVLARAGDDPHAVSTLARTAIKANEAIGKLTGEIRQLPSVLINNTNTQQINILETPSFRALERGLVEIAMRHPDAKADIAALVHRLRDQPEPPPAMIEMEHAHA